MAYTVPQGVMDYFRNGANQFGRYTDANGYQWMAQYEGGENSGDGGFTPGTFTGYRRGEIANELNDPFRAEATNLYFDPQGNYSFTNKDDPGWLNPITGILAVASLGLGAQYAAAAGAAEGAGAATTYGGATGAGLGSGSGAFLGEGAASGIGAWDGALSGATAGGAGAAGAGAGYLGDATAAGYGGLDAAGASTMGGGASVNGGAALGGTSAMGAGGTNWGDWASKLASGAQNMGMGDWAKLASAALGAYGGSQGVDNTQTTQNRMDPRLDPYLYGDLFPRAQGLLAQQFGQAQAQSGALNNVGMGLLNTNPTPDMANNSFMTGVANDIQRRTGDFLGQQFNNIRGSSINSGTLGGSRQGIAESEAMKGAADSLQGQLSNLYYGAYNQDANRNLQKIGMGAGLLGQSQQAGFAPLNSASDLYRPYTGLNSSMTTGGNTGGGWMGALGGALGGAQWANNMWGTK